MIHYRRKYYDIFSHFYDWVISLHSKDKTLSLRHYLARSTKVKPGDRALDLCTGTGAVASVMSEYVQDGLVVGADFSFGMLKKAMEKADQKGLKNIFFVVADAADLPFKANIFDVVTCSHAIYELTGQTRGSALKEIKRILAPMGRFCMMEHEEPKRPITRFLYHIRLLSMGKEGRRIVQNEIQELQGIFSNVSREITANGKTKLICCERD
ncbi:MAG: class I SAM-dependent methyltransferase [Dissulfurimicrobium sp.]|nr:class I SAM-dependent methyltransferase [Dissulfurimicrobium hydrothermale]UKL13105.1 class I SAM-dependent methyltransferase [Dissulfurimicrobium hydrothermale]